MDRYQRSASLRPGQRARYALERQTVRQDRRAQLDSVGARGTAQKPERRGGERLRAAIPSPEFRERFADRAPARLRKTPDRSTVSRLAAECCWSAAAPRTRCCRANRTSLASDKDLSA